ncbi:NAD(P)/FAD-dependent oxidoreductase [Mycobacteroides chelonae]|uniref:NAD(P)/FAD-dependent oxidoreductase n=1 Tax=Mycobacteroides chelonae TaxID=1774 RepID=UPI0004AABC3E|nr:NAD(P)/FAD-dependent oxidoreductase [Mycobacteroides chelonae]MBF9319001.1 FAD-dependent oxidoreductase [Mycobacteroides chelonae]OHT70340.1 FAD-dependent oxidoreductase [Mycobacteroides chelonae]OHT71274.1 FAD-dependent oxidoreductase [Mycobacteroides chelonae]OHT85776.1 FAD-dependent oxidoreductase [Mycobacteroides chelonae]
MSEPGLIIAGSGPAGVAAAESFREHNASAPVQILTADPDSPYERPPLSKQYLRRQTDDVILHPPSWYDERAIELISSTAIDRIDVDDRAVYAGEQRYDFRSLILASGAAPSPLSVPGGHHALLLRSLTDATVLRDAADTADSAVVVGAGFIGCEDAASLSLRGMSVTLVAPESLPQEARLGREAGERLRDLVTAAGVHYIGGVEVEEITGKGVRLNTGVTVAGDLTLAATGVTPQSRLATKAGIRVEDSRIVVGADMRTSASGVYAAGDVTRAWNAVAGRYLTVEHWQDAIDQGSVAGASAAGHKAIWDAVPGFWTTIGEATVKYHAWGDGYEDSRMISSTEGFTVWYEANAATVGVLTYNADDDYELGRQLIAEGRPAPTAAR